MSLKIKYYLIFLLTALLPVLTLGTLFFMKARADIERNLILGFEKTAQIQADQIELLFKNFKTDLTIAGNYWSIKQSLPELIKYENDKENPAFKNAIDLLNSQLCKFAEVKGFNDLILFDPEGRLVYSTSSVRHSADVCEMDGKISKDDFQEAEKDGICISGVFSCRGINMILILAPIMSKNDREVMGYIAFEVSMSMISGILQHTSELGISSETYLAKNNADRVLYISDSPHSTANGDNLLSVLDSRNQSGLAKGVIARKGSSWIGSDVKSNRVFAVWRNMPDLKLGLVAKIDTNEALFELHQIMKFIFLTTIGIIFIVSFYFFFIIGRITKPILKLHEAAKHIEQGDLDFRTNITRRDEIGQLAAAFDSMAATLKMNTTSIENLNAQIESRKIAESKLQHKTDELEAYFTNAIDLFCIADTDTKIIRVNQQWERFLGYAIDELKGRKYTDFVHPDDLKFTEISGANLSQDKPSANFINRCFAKDGSCKFLEWRVRLFNNTLYISARDITKRKKAEQKLKESEEKFRTLIKLSPIPICLIDVKGDFIYSNDGFVKLFGYTTFDMPNVESWWKKAYPDENYRSELRDLWEKNVDAARKDGADISPREVNITCKDGSLKVVDVASIMIDEKVLVTFIDNTERNASRARIETLLQEKEILLKEVHHRIKNNMSNISGLLMLQAQTLGGEAAKALEDAQSRLYSMSILYDRLYCSDNFNDITVKPYLEELSRSILMTLQESDKITLQVDIEDILIPAKMSFSIGIIVNELLTNIMKYAFAGRDKGEVIVKSFVKEGVLTLIVHDDGVGMPEITDINSSKGFGLSLIRMMTAQINGTIKVEKNGGTKVVIEIPYSPV